jgi:hypothetical protein
MIIFISLGLRACSSQVLIIYIVPTENTTTYTLYFIMVCLAILELNLIVPHHAMEIKLLSAWVVLLLCRTAETQRTILIKLSSELHVTSMQPIYYHESRPLVYEVEAPNLASLNEVSIPFRGKTKCKIPTRGMSLVSEIPEINPACCQYSHLVSCARSVPLIL